jgi:ABC-type nickel/cobalt efflux system permease component RcnA
MKHCRLPRCCFFPLCALCALCVFVVNSSPAFAHPVPKRSHDRVIKVRLTAEAVVVEYHLEEDEWTVVFADLPAVDDKVDLGSLKQPKDFYEAFTRVYGPILADNLTVTLDGQPLTLTCGKRSFQVKDSLWCDFEFRAPWIPVRARPLAFTFHEGNYELEAGRVQLSLSSEPPLDLGEKDEPDEALQKRPADDLKPGDDARLRRARAVFSLPSEFKGAKGMPKAGGEEDGQTKALGKPDAADAGVEKGRLRAPAAGESGTVKSGTQPEPTDSGAAPARPTTLLGLLLDSQEGFAVLLLLAAGFGAVHALTPGHGKTLVAAYLVGERGTAWHALLLGLVTTLAHTGAVLVLALVLPLAFPNALEQSVSALGLASGLLILGLGFWLLLRRLGGRADHFHLGRNHHRLHDHDHTHGHADHFHDEHGQVHALPVPGERVGWWGLVLLGLSGGMVPCVDAIVMFFFAVSAHRVWLGLPLLLAFSAGLASVLILIGLGVVWAKGAAQARLGQSGRWKRIFQALPVLSAVAVICMGLWMCHDNLASRPAPVPARAQPQP